MRIGWIILLITAILIAASLAMAQAPPAAPITTNDLKSVDVPKPEVRLKGDPDGGLRGRRHGAAILAIFTKTDGFAGAAADGTFLRQRTCHRVGNPFAWRIEP